MKNSSGSVSLMKGFSFIFNIGGYHFISVSNDIPWCRICEMNFGLSFLVIGGSGLQNANPQPAYHPIPPEPTLLFHE